MTKDQAKELLPIIMAFAEGKTIEVKNRKNEWNEMDDPHFDGDPKVYRIKPKPKYRPFKNAEECWKEIQKHECFGWIRFKNRTEDGYIHIEAVRNNGIFFTSLHIDFENALGYYTFIDGSPFGRKED